MHETFDVVFVVDEGKRELANAVALERLHAVIRPTSRVVVIGRRDERSPEKTAVRSTLERAGFEITTHGHAFLLPEHIPLLSTIANRWLARVPWFRQLCRRWFVVVRPTGLTSPRDYALPS